METTGHRMLVLLVVLVGCGGPILGTAGPIEGERMALGSDVLVLPTADYMDPDGKRAENSGSTATSVWRRMLSGSGFGAEVASNESVEAGLRVARQGNFDYVLESRITEWYDATREWKEKPDRVVVMARVYRASDGIVVAWGYDEAVGATSDDKVDPTHRLLSKVIRRMLSAFTDGTPVTEPPPDA